MDFIEPLAKFLKGYALLIIGLAAVLAGANAFAFWHVAITSVYLQWVLVVLGIIAFGINIYFGFKDRSNNEKELLKDYGIEIDSPQIGDRVQSPINITGRFKKQPPAGLLQAFEFNPNTNQYYPKAEVLYSAGTKKWTCTVHIGGADDKARIIKIASVGKSGKYFINYYNKVVNDTGKIYYIGVKDLPDDIKILSEVKIYLKQ